MISICFMIAFNHSWFILVVPIWNEWTLNSVFEIVVFKITLIWHASIIVHISTAYVFTIIFPFFWCLKKIRRSFVAFNIIALFWFVTSFVWSYCFWILLKLDCKSLIDHFFICDMIWPVNKWYSSKPKNKRYSFKNWPSHW